MSVRCTWEGCKQGSIFHETGKDGGEWAHLCLMHHNQLEDAMKDGNAKLILSFWVKAQGGSRCAADRMFKGHRP